MLDVNTYGYEEHAVAEVDGFRVVDATSEISPAHDDLVWVGYGGIEGRWMTTDKAIELAQAITSIANGNVARRERSAKAKNARNEQQN